MQVLATTLLVGHGRNTFALPVIIVQRTQRRGLHHAQSRLTTTSMALLLQQLVYHAQLALVALLEPRSRSNVKLVKLVVRILILTLFLHVQMELGQEVRLLPH